MQIDRPDQPSERPDVLLRSDGRRHRLERRPVRVEPDSPRIELPPIDDRLDANMDRLTEQQRLRRERRGGGNQLAVAE